MTDVRRRVLVGVAVMSLVAVSCAGDDGDEPDSADGTTDVTADTDDATEDDTTEPDDAVEDEECGLELEGECIAGQSLWEQAQDEGGIVLYTSLSEAREVAILDEFIEQTGIDVDYVRLTGAGLYERIQTELATGQLEADVIRDTDIALQYDHIASGAYEPYCPEFLEHVPEELNIDDCHVISSLMPVVAISYNTELVSEDEAPTNWEDLLDDRWAGGDIAFVETGAGGSTWARDLFLRMNFGFEHWERLAELQPTVMGSHGALTEAQARGEFAVAANLPGSVSLAIEDGAPLALVFPPDGVPSYSLWIGKASDAANEAAAEVFLNWTFSLAGQTAVAEKAGDYPVRSDAPAPVLSGTDAPDFNDANLWFAETYDEFVDLRDEWNAEWYDLIEGAR